jgi:CRISPR-associated protein Cmr2
MATVLLITIGPVQDFIAVARRCGDLWYGSWLLSELAKAAARGVVAALGKDGSALEALIFPGVNQRDDLAPGSPLAVANKLLVRIPESHTADQVAAAGQRAMNERRNELARAAFSELGKKDDERSRNFLEDRARAQLEELIEYLWVAVPEPEGSDSYASARREAERLLDARKNTKRWAQPPWSAAVPKSSLDGVRESVLREELFAEARRDSEQAEWLRREYGVRPSERLCGVGLLKRAGARVRPEGLAMRMRFPSTPHVAAIPFMIRGAGHAAAFQRFAGVLHQAFGPADVREVLNSAPKPMSGFGRADGQIFFQSGLAELAEESTRPDASTTGLALAQRALAQLFREIGAPGPMPYYALLLADGDRMGAMIEAMTSAGAHRALSLRLTAFAAAAADIVEQHQGGLIYAGGDDVLALLPLHSALACADALRLAFAREVGGSGDGREAPTLSVGLGISHYMEPMGAALALARESEKQAKQDRNALAVILEKRGGTRIAIHGRWQEAGAEAPLLQRLGRMIEMHLADAVPDKAAFELQELGARLQGHEDILKADAERILARKQPRHGQEERLDDGVLSELRSWGLGDPARLARELLIAKHFAEARELASPSGDAGRKAR